MNLTFAGYVEVYPTVSFDVDEDGPQLTSVMLNGVDLLPNMSDMQIGGLIDLAVEFQQIQAEKKQAAREDYGDYLYQMRKDEGMRA